MEKKNLDFARTFSEATTIGLKNAPSIVAAVLLFLLTCWIPYINIGTLIALQLLPTKLAKGEVINPLGIFDARYRRYMGEYLITMGLTFVPIFLGFWFGIIPGIVLTFTWSLSYYFLFEKGKNPIEALRASNDATYGSKWTIFFVKLVFAVAAIFISVVLVSMCIAIHSGFLTVVAVLLLSIFIPSVGMAIDASIWNQLKDNVK